MNDSDGPHCRPDLNRGWEGATVTQSQPGFGVKAETFDERQARVQAFDAQQDALDKLRQSWIKPSAQKATAHFAKTGPMEYEATSKEALEILTFMLDILQLGYNIRTAYGSKGFVDKWEITIYDPATMEEMSK